jgi:hypothetical protein
VLKIDTSFAKLLKDYFQLFAKTRFGKLLEMLLHYTFIKRCLNLKDGFLRQFTHGSRHFKEVLLRPYTGADCLSLTMSTGRLADIDENCCQRAALFFQYQSLNYSLSKKVELFISKRSLHWTGGF